RELVRGSHDLRQEIGCLQDPSDDRESFSTVAVEQPFVAVTVQEEVKLPGQIPNILQPCIHALPSKRTMNVGSIAGQEDTSDAHLRDVSTVNAKVAAPGHGVRFDPTRRPLAK